MASSYDHSVLEFDLNLLNQTTDDTTVGITVDQTKYEKMKTNLMIRKKKIVATDLLINRYVDKMTVAVDIEKNLIATKEECKQTCIDYKAALDKCNKLEHEMQVIQTTNKELEKRCYQLQNTCDGLQSHTNQLQLLIKEKDAMLESIKGERKEKTYNRDYERKVFSLEKKKKFLIKDIALFVDLVKKIIGKRKLKPAYNALLQKYDISSDGNYSDRGDTSDIGHDVYEDVIFSPPSIENIMSKKSPSAPVESDYDYSIDTGRGSSRASSDNEKCILSPDYYMTFSPITRETVENRAKAQVADVATSPILFEEIETVIITADIEEQDNICKRDVYTDTENLPTLLRTVDKCLSPIIMTTSTSVCTSPIKDLTTVQIKKDVSTITECLLTSLGTIDSCVSPIIFTTSKTMSTSPIKHFTKEVATSPVLMIDHLIPSENMQGAQEKECLELNNSNNMLCDNHTDFEIEMILNSMQLYHDVVTPIPRTPSKTRISDKMNEHSRLSRITEHVSTSECSNLEINNDTSELNNIKNELNTMKNILKQHILITSQKLRFNHEPLISKLISDNANVNMINNIDSNAITYSENRAHTSSINGSRIQPEVNEERALSESVSSPVDNISLQSNLSQIESDDNTSLKEHIMYNLLPHKSQHKIHDKKPPESQDLAIIREPTKKVSKVNKYIDLFGPDVVEDEKQTSTKDSELKRGRKKKMTKLDKLKNNLKPKYKIRSQTPPLVKKHLISKEQKKKIPENITSATLNDKNVYAKAVKVMAELNAKQNPRAHKIVASSVTDSISVKLTPDTVNSSVNCNETTPMPELTSKQNIKTAPSTVELKNKFLKTHTTQLEDQICAETALKSTSSSTQDCVIPKSPLEPIFGNSLYPFQNWTHCDENTNRKENSNPPISSTYTKDSFLPEDTEMEETNSIVNFNQTSSKTEALQLQESCQTLKSPPRTATVSLLPMVTQVKETTSKPEVLQDSSCKILKFPSIHVKVTDTQMEKIPDSSVIINQISPTSEELHKASQSLKSPPRPASVSLLAKETHMEDTNDSRVNLNQTLCEPEELKLQETCQIVKSPSRYIKVLLLPEDTQMRENTDTRVYLTQTLLSSEELQEKCQALKSLPRLDTVSLLPKDTQLVVTTDSSLSSNQSSPIATKEPQLQTTCQTQKFPLRHATVSPVPKETQLEKNAEGRVNLNQSLPKSDELKSQEVYQSIKCPPRPVRVLLSPKETQLENDADSRVNLNQSLPKSEELKSQEVYQSIQSLPRPVRVLLPPKETQLENNADSRVNLNQSLQNAEGLKSQEVYQSIQSLPKPVRVLLSPKETQLEKNADSRVNVNQSLQKSEELKSQELYQTIKSPPRPVTVLLSSKETQLENNVDSRVNLNQSLQKSEELKSQEVYQTIKSPPRPVTVLLLQKETQLEKNTDSRVNLNKSLQKSEELKSQEACQTIKSPPRPIIVSLLPKDTQMGEGINKCEPTSQRSLNVTTLNKTKFNPQACVVELTKYPIVFNLREGNNSNTRNVKDKVENEVSNEPTSRKRRRRSSNEPEIQCKRILRSSGIQRKMSTEDKEANGDYKRNSIKVSNVNANKKNDMHQHSVLDENSTKKWNSGINVVSYDDLSVFEETQSEKETSCLSGHVVSFNIQGNTNGLSCHPKESILCKMIEKYGMARVRPFKGKVPDNAAKFICEKIEQEITKIIEGSAHESIYTMNRFVADIQKLNYKHFITGLIKYLTKPERKSELFGKVAIPPAPAMTKAEQILIYVISQLKIHWPSVDIVDGILSNIEYTLFKLNRTPDFDVIESTSHFYALLCRYFGAKSRLRLFILDAMYCIQFKSVPLIKQCLDVWMHIIPLAHMGIAKSPLVTCLVYLLHFYKCDDKFNRVQEIRNILNRKYFYQITDWNEKKILEMFKNSINDLNNIPIERKMLRLALIILAKRNGARWCQNNIIKNLLLPMIEKQNVRNTVKEFCVSMIGPLMKPYPVDMKVHCEIAMNLLTDMLNKEPSQQMEETILTSMMFINRHNQLSINQTLLSRKMKPMSPELEAIICDYVKAKPLKVWKKHLTKFARL